MEFGYNVGLFPEKEYLEYLQEKGKKEQYERFTLKKIQLKEQA